MKVFKKSFLILGSVIGAGFASGKEIFEYFGKFGVYSLFIIIPLFFFLFFFFKTYLEFGYFANKTKNLKNKFFGEIIVFNKKINLFNIMSFVTFLILSSAMFTALIALFETYFPLKERYIYYIICILITFLINKLSLDWFNNLSNLFVPIIILTIIVNCICSFATKNFTISFGIENFSMLPLLAISYASQNAFFSSYILIETGKDLEYKEINKVSILSSIILCVLIVLAILCFCFNPSLIYCEMPFAEVMIKINPLFSYFFAMVLIFSILTTFISAISSFKQYFKGRKIYNNSFTMTFLIALLSLFNFGKIIKYFYPIIACFGLIYFIKIIFFINFKKKKIN